MELVFAVSSGNREHKNPADPVNPVNPVNFKKN
jgi:hypothetical protein